MASGVDLRVMVLILEINPVAKAMLLMAHLAHNKNVFLSHACVDFESFRLSRQHRHIRERSQPADGSMISNPFAFMRGLLFIVFVPCSASSTAFGFGTARCNQLKNALYSQSERL